MRARPASSRASSSLRQRVEHLERLVSGQRAEIQAQRDEICAQRSEIVRLGAERSASLPSLEHAPTLPPAPVALPSAPVLDATEVTASATTAQGRRSRRALLKLGGAAAAAGVAAVAAGAADLAHSGAAQAHSDTATITYTASGSGNTAIEGDGTSGAIGLTGTSDSSVGVYGASTNFYGVWGSSSSNIAVLGTSTTSTGVHGKTDGGFGVPGVHGIATQGTGVLGESNYSWGVQGSSTSGTGVSGSSENGDGVYGNSNSGVGGVFYGGRATVSLMPASIVPGAPTSGQHYGGDLYVDERFVLWCCIAAGTPGMWVRLTSVANGTPGGALNYLAAPIRLFDSRVGQPAPLPASKGALAGGSTTSIQVTGTSVGGLSVPVGATGVFGNLTVTNTQGPGDLILWPHGAPRPLTSNINYGPGQTVANSVNVGLSGGGAMDLFVHVNGTDVIFDVAGYVL
ncbi:MAG TPA: hypothetical protein VGR57_04060 [Ktedonobacterales bacterium]|nr:hypothetical protein [Ktedonobacterales bacterium]